MKLEQQVCSLELAKKLKELGVPQDSLFYWAKITEKGKEPYFAIFKGAIRVGEPMEYVASAFTVAELGEVLKPFYIDFAWSTLGKMWLCTLHKQDNKRWTMQSAHTTDADNEADSRAAMLIYLLENKLMTLEQHAA